MRNAVNLIPVVCLAVIGFLGYTNLSNLDDVASYDAPSITVTIDHPSK